MGVVSLITGIVGSLIGIVGIVFSILANKKAKIANATAKDAVAQAIEANRIAENANGLSEEANRISRRMRHDQAFENIKYWNVEWDRKNASVRVTHRGPGGPFKVSYFINGALGDDSGNIDNPITSGEDFFIKPPRYEEAQKVYVDAVDGKTGNQSMYLARMSMLQGLAKANVEVTIVAKDVEDFPHVETYKIDAPLY